MSIVSRGLVVAALCLCSSAHAFEPGPYFAVKAGIVRADFDGHDDAFNVGGVIGYHVGEAANGYVSIEGDVTVTLVEGDLNHGDRWGADTIAVFGTYRSMGDVYLKTKAGFAVQQTHDGDVPDESGVAFGFGLGFAAQRGGSIEVEYTLYDDLGFLSLAYVSRF